MDADAFEELLQTGNLTVEVTTEIIESETQPCQGRIGSSVILWRTNYFLLLCVCCFIVVLQHDLLDTLLESSMSDNSFASVSRDSLLVPSDSLDATVIVKTNGGRRTHAWQKEVCSHLHFIINQMSATKILCS